MLSKIFEFILKLTKPKYMDSKEELTEFFKKNNKDLKYNLSTFGNPDRDIIILYIHGGAYINGLNLQHKLYCNILSRILNSHVVAPEYPLAPDYTYKETYELITKVYKDLLKLNKHIILMGDSAGGGFAISFCQYLKTVNLAQPKNLITFSPWVDLSMSGDYSGVDDPILGETGLREIGKKWAGDLDTKHYKVSPLFGDSTGIAKSLIFAGEHEIFYSDIKEYVKKNNNTKLIVGKKLFHVYPLFPMPEAWKALKIIKKEISSQ